MKIKKEKKKGTDRLSDKSNQMAEMPGFLKKVTFTFSKISTVAEKGLGALDLGKAQLKEKHKQKQK